jgi:hypothetical protein
MESVFVDQRLDLGQFGHLVDQGTGVITDQGVPTVAAISGPAVGDGAQLLRWDQATQYPAMSRLPAPFATGGPGGRLALEPDGIGRRGLGGIGGIELEPGFEITDALLQFSDLSLEGVQHGQDGKLGLRWDGVPERFGDGRLRDHAIVITKLLDKRFDP